MTDQKTTNCGHVELSDINIQEIRRQSKFLVDPGCTPHIIPLPRHFLNTATMRKTASLERAISAVVGFARELERHKEEIRWRNDPLQLKARFLDPIPVFVAEQLRAIANRIEP